MCTWIYIYIYIQIYISNIWPSIYAYIYIYAYTCTYIYIYRPIYIYIYIYALTWPNLFTGIAFFCTLLCNGLFKGTASFCTQHVRCRPLYVSPQVCSGRNSVLSTLQYKFNSEESRLRTTSPSVIPVFQRWRHHWGRGLIYPVRNSHVSNSSLQICALQDVYIFSSPYFQTRCTATAGIT